jgi:hypothetical protein
LRRGRRWLQVERVALLLMAMGITARRSRELRAPRNPEPTEP